MGSITNEQVEFDQEDWSYVSASTQKLVERLLSKDPDHRAGTDEIIKHIWKVEVSGSGWQGARNRLKQLVIKRKFGQRASYDDSNIAMDQEEMKKNNRSETSSKNENRRKRKQNGQRKKGRDHNILENMAPMNYRDSFVVAEMKDQDDFVSKKQNNASLSSSHRKMETVDEDEDKQSDRHRQRNFL